MLAPHRSMSPHELPVCPTLSPDMAACLTWPPLDAGCRRCSHSFQKYNAPDAQASPTSRCSSDEANTCYMNDVADHLPRPSHAPFDSFIENSEENEWTCYKFPLTTSSQILKSNSIIHDVSRASDLTLNPLTLECPANRTVVTASSNFEVQICGFTIHIFQKNKISVWSCTTIIIPVNKMREYCKYLKIQ